MRQRLPSGVLPGRDALPELIFTLPELQYPPRLNACRELLDSNLADDRDPRTAIFCHGGSITYDELSQSVETLAASLLDMGLVAGDRVVLRFQNRPEFVISWLAVLRVGGIVVSTMPLLRSRELAAIVADCTPAFFLTQEELWPDAEAVLAVHPDCKVIVSGGSHAGCIPWDAVLNGQKKCPPAETAAEDIALLAYTSGSTGEPKGTVHTHRDILAIADGYARHILSPTPDDVFGGPPTLAFTFGLGGLLVFPCRIGGATSLIDRFSPAALIEAIQTTGITVLFASATTYNILLKSEVPGFVETCKKLRLCVSAGETLPPPTYAAWKESTGVDILDGIGSTEMLHIFVSNRPGRIKPGTTGRAVPGYQARIVDEQMRDVPIGHPGLLAVKGPTGCRYWNRPDHQRQYVRDGWNIPGDIFIQDEDGYFAYQCRADDMIICGGYNIAGPEVEAVLLEHAAVQECAVVASPDATRGTVPKAFVVVREQVKPGPELIAELQCFAKERLAAYKYPRRVEFISALPKTQTGKIRRVELRQREMDRHHLRSSEAQDFSTRR